MRAILAISFLVTTALVSTAALAADDGAGKPAQNLIRVLPASKPAVSAQATPVKQVLPATRQIVPEANTAPQTQLIQSALPPQPAPAPVAAPAPVQVAPPVAPPAAAAGTPAAAPTLAASDVPDVTGTLQADTPAAAAPVAPPADQPVAPPAAGKPADAQVLVQGDAGAAPKVEEQVAPQPAPVAPIVRVKPRKKYARYYDDRGPYNHYTRYSYRPRYSYSNGGYGGDGCQ